MNLWPKTIQTSMTQSAKDFADIVWPTVRNTEFIGGGSLIPVEANKQKGLRDELDYIAGIDAWHVADSNRQMRGLATRVQRCSNPWHSFTIRFSLASGNATEYAKRLEAIYSSYHGGPNWLFPDLTVQAYVHPLTNKLLAWAVIPTTTLFLEAERLITSGAIESPAHPLAYGLREAPGGNTFIFIGWDHLGLKYVGDATDVAIPRTISPLVPSPF